MSLPQPYYQDDYVTIYHGDCREIMQQLPDKSVDLVLTSPQFNLGDTFHTGNYRFRPYEDDSDELDYQLQQLLILNRLYQLVKDDGSLFYQHKNRIKRGISITPYQWLLKSDWLVKQEIVWFNRSQNFDKCRFYPMTERIYWLAKREDTELVNLINRHDDWHITPVGTAHIFKRAFPEELVDNILVCFPNADLILDPFLGSGTTAYCAKKLNRKCIGIEIEEKYCEIAANRCRQMVFDLSTIMGREE